MPSAPIIRTFGTRLGVANVFDFDDIVDQVGGGGFEVYGGSMDPGCTVELFIDGIFAGNAMVGERTPGGTLTYRWSGVFGPGSWVFQLTDAVPHSSPQIVRVGHHTVTAIATDALGNRSIPSEPFRYITTALPIPGAPQIRTPLNGTRTNAIPIIAGLGKEDGSIVEVYIDGNLIGRTRTSCNQGECLWSFTPSSSLGAGTHTITARQYYAQYVDPLYVSMSSPRLRLIIDTTAPSTRITSPSDNTRINNNTPTITGITTESPSTVQLTIDGIIYGGPIPTLGDGSWSFTIPTTQRLLDGVHSILAKATDAVGNTGDLAPSINIIIDVTPPRVINTIPVDRETGVLTTDPISGTPIIVIFNEEMNSSTITTGPSGTFIVRDNSRSDLVRGTVYLNTNRRTATFVPVDNLGFSTTYSATITTEVKDLAGNHMNADYQWSFITEEAPIIDTIAPQVIGTRPTDLARDVSVTTSITATFNKQMNSSAITASTFIIKDIHNNDVAGTVSLSSDGKVARFDPTSDLVFSTTYSVIITTEVKDLAGNHMNADYKWSFITGKEFASTASGVNSCIENLEKLVDWRQREILTNEEFEKLKSLLILTLYNKSLAVNPALLLSSFNNSAKIDNQVTDLETKTPLPVESVLPNTYLKPDRSEASTLTPSITEKCHIMLLSRGEATIDCTHSQDGECEIKISISGPVTMRCQSHNSLSKENMQLPP